MQRVLQENPSKTPLMTWLFVILLSGLPFSHFIFQKFHIWMAHGLWFQIGLLVLFCYALFDIGVRSGIANKPLALFTGWLGFITAYNWCLVLKVTEKYPVILFFPFFNFLCFVLFYQIATRHLTYDTVNIVLRYIRYAVTVLLLYSVLQIFDLEQFYKMIGEARGKVDYVGTLGNASHLGGYLALCAPLFFRRKRRDLLALILLWLVVLFTKSASGIAGCAVGLVTFHLFRKRYHTATILSLCLIGVGIVFYRLHPEFFNNEGRVFIWIEVWQRCVDRFITGYGLGVMQVWRLKHITSYWLHAHQEYLQLLAEGGIISLLLLLGVLKHYYATVINNCNGTVTRLASVFTVFLTLCFFTFPAHLWLMASMGMVGYSFVYALSDKGQPQWLSGQKKS